MTNSSAVIRFKQALFCELTNTQLYQCLKLRSDIFVVEQECVYPDLDDKDIHAQTTHIMMFAADTLAGYARVLAPAISYDGASIGRVAIAKENRGQGLAKKLMEYALSCCFRQFPDHDVDIGAQVYLQHFYESLGFVVMSQPYDEDGIMHIDMRLPAINLSTLFE